MTVTNNYSLTLPTVGGDTNIWGTILNTNTFTPVDNALAGVLAVSVTSSDVPLTASQFQNAVFTLSGALTGNRNLTVPLSPNSATIACAGRFVVVNGTSGAFNVTVKTVASGSTGVTVPQGFVAFLYSDGTNVGYTQNGLPAYALASNGDPNGSLAGTAGSVNTNVSLAYDYANNIVYACTTTGSTSTAVWTQLSVTVPRGFNMPINFGLAVTHTGGNLLNVAVKTSAGTDPTAISPVITAFQTLSGTATTGAPTAVNITAALSMTSNATGATLGTSNSVPFRIWIALFNNAGTAVLAIMNASTATQIYSVAEYGVASTTGISGTATSAGVWYTPNGTSLTSKAYRLVGYCEYTSGLATAGTFSSDPSNTVLFGPGIKKPGDVIQAIYSRTGATAAGTTAMPFDDTIPQNTEGVEFMTASVTPSSKINVLFVEAQGSFNNDLGAGASGAIFTMALFQDTTANALAAIWNNPAAAVSIGASAPLLVSYSMVANTISSTTFKIRAGINGGGASNHTTFNGVSNGDRRLGGVCNSFINILEIMG